MFCIVVMPAKANTLGRRSRSVRKRARNGRAPRTNSLRYSGMPNWAIAELTCVRTDRRRVAVDRLRLNIGSEFHGVGGAFVTPYRGDDPVPFS